MFILKQLRRKKNISQTDLANAIGVSLRTIQLYEKKDANIPFKNLTKIADYFEVGIGELYNREVNEADVVYNRSDTKDQVHQIRKLSPGKYLVTAPLVTRNAYSSYLQHFEDRNFMTRAPRVGFVIDQVSAVNYAAFEIANSAMDSKGLDGIPQAAIVLGKQVQTKQLAKKLKEMPHAQWIIIYKDSIICRQLTSIDKKKGSATCHSLNPSPEYPDFEIVLADIKQLFLIIKKQLD